LRLGIEDYAIEVEKSCLKHFIHHFSNRWQSYDFFL